MPRRSPTSWTMPVIDRVRRMAALDMSDSGIAGALMVYEGLDVNKEQVRQLRRRFDIEKPSTQMMRDRLLMTRSLPSYRKEES